MKNMTAMPFDERAAARRRLDAYLTGTLPVLDAGGWEAHLGVTSGADHIVTGGIGYEPGSEDTGYELRLTLIPGRETECVIEMLGHPHQIHRDLPLGVPVPTTDEALRIYLDAFGHPEDGDE